MKIYSIGAFLGGKLMAVFPNQFKYYKELYEYAINLSEESGVFIEVRYFDSDAYKQTMELLKEASTISEEIKQQVYEDIDKQVIEEIDKQIENENRAIGR
jgi:hypothetical protein